MSALDNLRREVQETRDTVQAGVTLIQGLAQQIRDNVGNETELQRLADELDASGTALAAAITENTPASPVDPEPEQPVG